MTTQQLTEKFNHEFALGVWPKTYEVDAETYGYVCQSLFEHYEELYGGPWVSVALGPYGGVMFKNVELMLKGGKR